MVVPLMIMVWIIAFAVWFAINSTANGTAPQNPQARTQEAMKQPMFLIPVLAAIAFGGGGIALCGASLSPIKIRTRLALNPSGAGWLALVLLPIGTLGAGAAAISLVQLAGIRANQGTNQIVTSLVHGSSPAQFGMFIIVVSLLPAICEELLFRGYIQTRLIARWGSRWGVRRDLALQYPSMNTLSLPIEITDPINARILAISEDKLAGFQPDPLGVIAAQTGIDTAIVTERVRGMLQAGTIRRVRQTLMATNLARGALVAWQVPEEKLAGAFDWMFGRDPFSGHVVIRSTDAGINATRYRLWTTLKVPQGFSMERHCEFLIRQTGCLSYRLMPAKRLFALGVGHVRRKGMQPGSKSDELAEVLDTNIVELSELEWRVLLPLKREFTPEEMTANLWQPRAEEAGVPLETFYEVARKLNERGVVGRFSTFLEHVKPSNTGERVTKFNALFHWAVPPGREIDAGRQVGRFHIMTHAYWREGGPEFHNVNVMGVAHGTEKSVVLAHKAAIDEHLEAVGIPVGYTNVFWGGRSEIKPSEISPIAYEQWCAENGVDAKEMR
jgi:membrane protease YdiL (CAAX protease family)